MGTSLVYWHIHQAFFLPLRINFAAAGVFCRQPYEPGEHEKTWRSQVYSPVDPVGLVVTF